MRRTIAPLSTEAIMTRKSKDIVLLCALFFFARIVLIDYTLFSWWWTARQIRNEAMMR